MHRFFARFAHHRHFHARGFGEADDAARFMHAGRGPFGRGRGAGLFDDGSDPRGGGRSGGRMFGHGDLKLLLLALIEQQPRHGYELIRVIEDMFHGTYAPSPGAVYPTLTLLEDMGHAQSREEGGRKRYEITDAGRAFLDENRAAVEAVTAAAGRVAREAAKRSLPLTVRSAMHALKHALLMRDGGWSKTEAERVAGILERAAADIAAGFRRD